MNTADGVPATRANESIGSKHGEQDIMIRILEEPEYTPLVKEILGINPNAYLELAPKMGPTPAVAKLLDSVTLDQLFPTPITSPVAAHMCLAGLWLWNDGLDQCHQIVQQSPEELFSAARNLHQTPSTADHKSGSGQTVESQQRLDSRHLREMEVTLAYWHGIMHRREPDFDNAKYWFRRVGQHPVFEELLAAARQLWFPGTAADSGCPPQLAGLLANDAWNPCLFVDLCQQAGRGRQGLAHACQRLADLEWRLLFRHSYRKAVGH